MRRHGLKKGLSLLLVFCMILSLLPMTALAEEISEPSAAVEEQDHGPGLVRIGGIQPVHHAAFLDLCEFVIGGTGPDGEVSLGEALITDDQRPGHPIGKGLHGDHQFAVLDVDGFHIAGRMASGSLHIGILSGFYCRALQMDSVDSRCGPIPGDLKGGNLLTGQS